MPLLIRTCFLLGLVWIGMGPVQAQVVLQSGKYGDLNIACNKATYEITGYYETGKSAKDKQQRSCRFYFKGMLKANRAVIRVWDPSDDEVVFAGLLTVLSSGKLSLKIAELPAKCNALNTSFAAGKVFTLEENNPWIQLRYAVADKAFFYALPKDDARKNVFAMPYEIIYLMKVEGAWGYGYAPGEHPQEGFVKISGLNKMESK